MMPLPYAQSSFADRRSFDVAGDESPAPGSSELVDGGGAAGFIVIFLFPLYLSLSSRALFRKRKIKSKRKRKSERRRRSFAPRMRYRGDGVARALACAHFLICRT